MSRGEGFACLCGMARKAQSVQRRLGTYRKKRRFASPKTKKGSPEPVGKARPRKKRKKGLGLIFCVQKHLASHLHYDFRLEHAGVLLSWAVPKGPSLNPADKRLAMRVEDHPLEYADFEGVIPHGYGAGIVMLWDKGTWESENGDVAAGLEKGELKFRLHGVKLKGSFVLVRTRPAESQWLLIKHRDNWSGAVDVVGGAPLSVKSFGDFADIAAADAQALVDSEVIQRGGAVGKMLRDIVADAVQRLTAKQGTKPSRRHVGSAIFR